MAYMGGGGQLLWRTCGIEGIGISEHAYGRYEYSGNGEVREEGISDHVNGRGNVQGLSIEGEWYLRVYVYSQRKISQIMCMVGEIYVQYFQEWVWQGNCYAYGRYFKGWLRLEMVFQKMYSMYSVWWKKEFQTMGMTGEIIQRR
jgi:hypothetical protein